MKVIEEAVAVLGVPGSTAVAILILFAVLQLIGELIEVSGKVAPAIFSVRRWLKKKREKEQAREKTLEQVCSLLADVNAHYSKDNITQRDDWIAWVNKKAELYDQKVEELIELKEKLSDIAAALSANTETTDEMFKESCRDRIINFASKVINPLALVSKEEFTRIFKVYDAYEAFLAAHNQPNGEVETNYAIIREAYATRIKTMNFIEYRKKDSVSYEQD